MASNDYSGITWQTQATNNTNGMYVQAVQGPYYATASILTFWPPVGYEEPKRRNRMTLYRAYVIDRFKGEVLSEHTVVGRDTGEAALNFSLTAEEKALKQKDDLEIIWQTVGQFDKVEVTRTRQE